MIELYDLPDNRGSCNYLHIHKLSKIHSCIPYQISIRIIFSSVTKASKKNLCNNIIFISLHIRIFIFVEYDDKESR